MGAMKIIKDPTTDLPAYRLEVGDVIELPVDKKGRNVLRIVVTRLGTIEVTSSNDRVAVFPMVANAVSISNVKRFRA
jgi:hypothetical protein